MIHMTDMKGFNPVPVWVPVIQTAVAFFFAVAAVVVAVLA